MRLMGKSINEELYISDGTSSGTTVFDLATYGYNGNNDGSNPNHLTEIGDTLYFQLIHGQYINKWCSIFRLWNGRAMELLLVR